MNKYILFFSIIIISHIVRSNSEEITVEVTNCQIKGTLTIPTAKNKVPILILVAGSGPTDRNCNQPAMKTNAYQYLADSLLKNNIACLRYDKRGIASSCPGGMENQVNFENFISDLSDLVDFCSKDKRIGKIYIGGHSEGSLIGMIVARKNKKVSAFISIAGSGVSIDQKLKEQLANLPEETKNIAYSMLDKLKKGDTIANIPKGYESLFRPSVQPYLISWMKYDPQIELNLLTKPILIIQGTTDIQVSLIDAELLAKSNPKAKKIMVSNMNHILKYCESSDPSTNMKTYNQADLVLHSEFCMAIVDFIKEN